MRMRPVLHKAAHKLGVKMGGRLCFFIADGRWIRIDRKATKAWKKHAND